MRIIQSFRDSGGYSRRGMGFSEFGTAENFLLRVVDLRKHYACQVRGNHCKETVDDINPALP